MNKKIFLRRINAYISFINTPNSHIPTTNLSISLSKYGILYPPIEILDEMFNSASNLLQDLVPIVQCPGSEACLAKPHPNTSQPNHKNGSLVCDTSCAKFKSYKYAAIQLQLLKKKSILKHFYSLCDQTKQNSDLVNVDVSKNTEKKRCKVMQIRKDNKQVKENPVIQIKSPCLICCFIILNKSN